MTTVHAGRAAGVGPHSNPVEQNYQALLAALRREDRRDSRRSQAFADLGPVVYFLWRAPYIKIGHSADLRSRLRTLRCRPEQVLAVESGALSDEAERHAQFTADRVYGEGLGREHYWPSAALLSHINDLRNSAGVPPLKLRLVLAN